MSKNGIEKSAKLLWVLGNCVWCPMVLILWWHGYQAQTFAQASLSIAQLGTVSGIGAIWSIVGAVWLSKSRKTRGT
jgi:Na+/melibiose symporter-like transporter